MACKVKNRPKPKSRKYASSGRGEGRYCDLKGLSGGVEIGENSWIGPNSSIFQKVKIGKRCTIGLGANIFKDMHDGEIFMGVPGRKIKKGNG